MADKHTSRKGYGIYILIFVVRVLNLLWVLSYIICALRFPLQTKIILFYHINQSYDIFSSNKNYTKNSDHVTFYFTIESKMYRLYRKLLFCYYISNKNIYIYIKFTQILRFPVVTLSQKHLKFIAFRFCAAYN